VASLSVTWSRVNYGLRFVWDVSAEGTLLVVGGFCGVGLRRLWRTSTLGNRPCPNNIKTS
jgi:hypothetical protein